MMVIWLYFNHILNNFVVILTYTFMIAIIKFVVSMAENVVLEARTVEEEHVEATISTVSTSTPGK
jgi:Na+/citrate or Na+/malate symporter